MSTPPKPEIISTNYNDIAVTHSVRADGATSSRTLAYEEEYIQALTGCKHLTAKDLGWVSFFKQGIVRVEHPDSIVPKMAVDRLRNKKSFALELPKVRTEATQFVDDITDGQWQFKTETEILERGVLSPYMRTWLGKLAMKPKYWSPELNGFLPLLPGAPKNAFEITSTAQ